MYNPERIDHIEIVDGPGMGMGVKSGGDLPGRFTALPSKCTKIPVQYSSTVSI